IEELNTALCNNAHGILPIVTKHEEGAAFMADGYARVSGRLGVCYATSGPGATNLITGLISSYVDQIPVLALTGQVATSMFGKGAFQESGSEWINLSQIFSNFTKYSSMLISEDCAQNTLLKAIRLALNSPGGPAHINMPVDIMKRHVQLQEINLANIGNTHLFDVEQVDKAVKLLAKARHPAIIAGWGTYLSQAMPELRQLAELLQIPVATTPKAKGVFPESHELSLGVLGFAGSPIAKEYIIDNEVDVLFAVGTGFSEMMTNGWDKQLQPSEHLVHLDINIEKIGKNYPVSHPILGDPKINLERIIQTAKTITHKIDRTVQRNNHLQNLQQRKTEKKIFKSRDNLYHPAQLMFDIQKFFPQKSLFFADIGTSMAWAIRYMTIDQPGTFFVSLGYGSMGYAVAASVGGCLAAPDRPVVVMVGDGSFLMNGFEVATAVNYNIPVVWVVLNNAMLGMIYHGRRLVKEAVPEVMKTRFKRVDYAQIAEGLGARGIHVDATHPLSAAMVEEILTAQEPTVLDVWIDDQAVPPIHSRIKTMDIHFS
ncbi:MAG: thiamine pyrophosphate-binding protein, partial [Candidatus Electrothrix sp. ATG2]|nr:thiamine pyrophosphate-binding protein [Candidatus Electrothrix sp. ATG2]